MRTKKRARWNRTKEPYSSKGLVILVVLAVLALTWFASDPNFSSITGAAVSETDLAHSVETDPRSFDLVPVVEEVDPIEIKACEGTASCMGWWEPPGPCEGEGWSDDGGTTCYTDNTCTVECGGGDPADLTWANATSFRIYRSSDLVWGDGDLVCEANLTDTFGVDRACEGSRILPSTLYRVEILLNNSGGSSVEMQGFSEAITLANVAGTWGGTTPIYLDCGFNDFGSDDSGSMCSGSLSSDDIVLRKEGAGTVTIAANNGLEGIMFRIRTDSDPTNASISFLNTTIDTITEDSSNISITANTLPNITAMTILPAVSYTNTTINVSTTFTDADGDNGTVYFNWTVDSGTVGTEVYTQTDTVVTNNSLVVSNLSSGNFSKGQVVNVSVYAYDGYSNSSTIWANITIGNLAPTFGASLVNKSANSGTAFLYSISCSDLDTADTVTYYDNTTLFNISALGSISVVPSQVNDGSHKINITCGDGTINRSLSFNYTIEDIQVAAVSVVTPLGTTNDTTPTLNISTNENATCSYRNETEGYVRMNTTGTTTHMQNFSTALNISEYVFFVQCNDTRNNTGNLTIPFAISASLENEGNTTNLTIIANISQSFKPLSNLNITLNISTSINSTISTAEYNSTPEEVDLTVEGSTVTKYRFYTIGAEDLIKNNINLITLKITYNETLLTTAGIAEAALATYFYNSTSGLWQAESASAVNSSGNFVEVNVTHLSTFVIGKVEEDAVAAARGGGGKKSSGDATTETEEAAEEVGPTKDDVEEDAEEEEETSTEGDSEDEAAAKPEIVGRLNLAGRAFFTNVGGILNDYSNYWLGFVIFLTLAGVTTFSFNAHRKRRRRKRAALRTSSSEPEPSLYLDQVKSPKLWAGKLKPEFSDEMDYLNNELTTMQNEESPEAVTRKRKSVWAGSHDADQVILHNKLEEVNKKMHGYANQEDKKQRIWSRQKGPQLNAEMDHLNRELVSMEDESLQQSAPQQTGPIETSAPSNSMDLNKVLRQKELNEVNKKIYGSQGRVIQRPKSLEELDENLAEVERELENLGDIVPEKKIAIYNMFKSEVDKIKAARNTKIGGDNDNN